MAIKKTVQSSSAQEAQKSDGDTDLKPMLTASDDKLWVYGAIGELRTRKLIEPDDSKDTFEIATIYREAFMETEYFNASISPIQNITNFALWLDREEWRYEVPVLFNVAFVTISCTMQTPSGSVTIGLEATPLSSDMGSVIKAMHKQLSENMLAVYGKSSSGTTAKNTVEGREDKPTKEDKPEWINFSTLRAQEHNEELKFYLMPDAGRWKTHGVRLFDNQFQKFGIDEVEEEGDYTLQGKMLVGMNGKYPNIQDITLLDI